MTKTKPVKAVALKPVTSKSTTAAMSKPLIVKAAVTKPTVTKPVTAKKAAIMAASSSPKTSAAKVVAPKPVKVVKAPKVKMERDSFTMPKAEYAQFNVLKERLQKLGSPAKKSELLRAGIMQLSAMTDAALSAVMSKVPTIKTGRPKK